MGSNGRPRLTADKLTEIALYARAGTGAQLVSLGRAQAPRVVAELALIAGPGRADLIDAVTAPPGTSYGREMPTTGVDWPPRALVAELLALARGVTMGDVALRGPGGLVVEQIRLDGRALLRARVGADVWGDARTTAELETILARRGVQLDQLEAEEPAGE